MCFALCRRRPRLPDPCDLPAVGYGSLRTRSAASSTQVPRMVVAHAVLKQDCNGSIRRSLLDSWGQRCFGRVCTHLELNRCFITGIFEGRPNKESSAFALPSSFPPVIAIRLAGSSIWC